MIDSLTSTWSRPLRIVRVLQAMGMEVPARLRRERLALMLAALKRSGIEASLADGTPIDPEESPGIEAKIRLRRVADSPPLGSMFGYEVLAPIPGGGMSDCFKVRASDGEVRFLKRVRVSGVNAPALNRELEVYAKLERAEAANVLRVYECKRDGDFMALVTEFADGGTLAGHIEPQGLSVTEAKTVALAVLAGLRSLHGLNIVHRDLKPQNVLRSGDEWKLCDFGISKNLTRLVTQGPTFQGAYTLGYSPPEQRDGSEAHASADVYALGKLLVFVLTGQTDIDCLEGPLGWRTLVRRCTQFSPAARPSLDDVEAELTRL